MLKNILLAVGGFITIIAGVYLILKNFDQWINILVLCAGPLLGVIGLVMMFMATVKEEKRK